MFHQFQSPVPDNNSPTDVGTAEWNAKHILVGGTDGDTIIRDSTDPHGWKFGRPDPGLFRDGNVSQPAMAFKTEPSLGGYRVQGGVYGWAVNASLIASYDTQKFNFVIPVQVADGAVNNPIIRFTSQTGTGIYKTPDGFAFTINNVGVLGFKTGSVYPIQDMVPDLGESAAKWKNLYLGGLIELTERAVVGNPAVNKAWLWAKDNGSGKTQLVVIFASGGEFVLATQP
jgi:hypothetical protein